MLIFEKKLIFNLINGSNIQIMSEYDVIVLQYNLPYTFFMSVQSSNFNIVYSNAYYNIY